MRKIAVLLVFLAASLAPSIAMSHDHGDSSIEIVHAWAPFTAEADAKSLAVYMIIKNRGGAPDRLIHALANVASKVDVHGPSDGMKSVSEVTIDPSKDFELSSTGPHLFLTGLNRRLQLHDRFKLALEFERVGRIVVDVMVEDPAAREEHKH